MEAKNYKKEFMNSTNSSFVIKKGDLQVSFNYFYFLGYSLNEDDDESKVNEKLKSCKSYIFRDWKNSEASHYLRNSHLEDLLLDHFHMDVNHIFNTNITVNPECLIENKNIKYQFSIDSSYYTRQDGENSDSIAAIECSILKNGQLFITVRFISTSDEIPSYDVIDLIKKPEFIKSQGNIDEVGGLIKKANEVIGKIENYLLEILNIKQLKRYRFDAHGDINAHNSLISEAELNEFLLSRSRPYIGVLFRFSNLSYDQIQHQIPSIRRFVIAASRTTPVFTTRFIDENEYLYNRDIYNPGRSIVFIGRRGWCIFDSEEQDRQTFMLGTVESTQLVVLAIHATARSWRKYIKDSNKIGEIVYQELHETIDQFITDFSVKGRKKFIEKLGSATSFLAMARLVSPEKGISRLLEAHVMSHTARSAVRRCEDLTHLRELEKVSNERMDEYLDFMKTAENYLQVKSTEYTEINLSKTQKILYLTLAIILLTIVFNILDHLVLPS